MNKKLTIFLHLAFWGYMFLSPLTYMRGTGITLVNYLSNCVAPLLMMIVFYLNFLWLTPRYFVSGKHRYYILINLILVTLFGIAQNYWMNYAHELFYSVPPPPRQFTFIDFIFFVLRDIINLAIFAMMATALVLAFRWQHNEDARLEAEAARSEAELKNLRSQVNPHFLLNTLNNIYALTAIDQSRAQEAVLQLSQLLRHILYDNQEAEVALKDEIKFMESYINLMKIRLSGNVDVRFDSRVTRPDLRVAPLLAVSLVENAFKHGISPTEPSFVHVLLSTDENQMICLIENSNHPKTEEDRSGHGVGLEQVQRRLDLSYAGRYEWEKGPTADGKRYISKIILHI
jgi:two-component sensor histidine kinase